MTLLLGLAPVHARPARLDVLCGAYLTRVADAGRRLDARALEREVLAPLALVAASIRAHGAGAGLVARFLNLFRPSPDDSSEHFSFLEDDLRAIPTALGRRDAARAIEYRLKTLIHEAKHTPASATPLSHVLRGRAEVLKFLRGVRATTAEVHAELEARHAATIAEFLAQKASRAAEPPPEVTRAEKFGLLAGYGVLVAGAAAWIGTFNPPLTPALAALFGSGVWVTRAKLYAGYRSLRRRASLFVFNRGVDRAVNDVEAREAAVTRAEFELHALDEMIELVAAASPVGPKFSHFAYYTHTVDLPIPLAEAYHDDRYLAADVVIDAIEAGHVPFIGGRRARLTHSLHFEDGVPVLITLLQEQLQAGIADLYLMDDP